MLLAAIPLAPAIATRTVVATAFAAWSLLGARWLFSAGVVAAWLIPAFAARAFTARLLAALTTRPFATLATWLLGAFSTWLIATFATRRPLTAFSTRLFAAVAPATATAFFARLLGTACVLASRTRLRCR